MISAEHHVSIARPRSEVYAFLADGLNNPAWRNGVQKIELASGPAGAEGAVYAQTLTGPGGRAIAGDYRITKAVPDERLEFEVIAGPARPTGVFELTGHDGGTDVRFTLALEPKGLMRLMSSMIGKTMNGEVARLQQLKETLEK